MTNLYLPALKEILKVTLLPNFMYKFLSFIFFCLLTAGNFSFGNGLYLKDSIGIEKKNGKNFILHKIEAKETFYSLSKRYKVSIDDIVNNNIETREGLKIDQIIKIPFNVADLNNSESIVINNNKGADKLSKGSFLHRVKPSETLYSISKLYNVKVEELKNWNLLSGNEVNIDQELVIKKDQIQPAIQSETESNAQIINFSDTLKPNIQTEGSEARVVHTVEPTQTLFSISKMYNVSVEDIKNWNSLENSELNVGQKLTVIQKTEQQVRSEAKVEKKPEFLANDDSLPKQKFEEYEASTKRTSKAETEKAEKVKPAQKIDNSGGGNKIIELGFAEVIEGTDDTKKFRALHKTAPVGTIIQVKNEMNNLSVFVRVLGTLPNTGSNDKVLIKITKAAYERLGAIDPRFPVELSYVP
jgi:LysM repeat protein